MTVPTYEYRCDRDGLFEVQRSPGAHSQVPCPDCARPGARVFTAPMLSRAPRAVGRAIDRAARTREAPDVVTQPPRTARASRSPDNPALRRLPRP